jgi:ADP-ribose pyrophosphatase
LKPERLGRTTIYESDWVSLHQDRVELQSGQIIEQYHVIDFPRHSVVALVEDSTSRLLLVRIHRHVVGRTGWELPAGGVDDGESPLAAAAREVFEETGTQTTGAKLLGTYHPSNGSTNQTVHVVHCRAESGIGTLDTDEILEAAWFSRAGLDELLDAGEIRDGLTLTALFFLQRAERLPQHVTAEV